jgi:hypothetical protein
MRGRPTFEEAKARYVHRFTMEYVPRWALEQRPDGSHYAPQYRSDREWYEHTKFPGEPGLHGNSKRCETTGQTWPLGQTLSAPYRKAS